MTDYASPAHISDSDISRRAAERLDDAVAVLSTFVDPTNLHRPLWDAVSLRTNPAEVQRLLAKGVPNAERLAQAKFGKLLKANCVDPDLRIARVNLTTETDDRPPFLGYPEDPQLVFATLSTASPRFRPSEREAFCAYFDPMASGGMRQEPIIDPNTGESLWLPWSQRLFIDRVKNHDGTWKTYIVANDYDAGSYVGVLRWYPSVTAAEEAATEVARAMATLATDASDTAMTTDPVRYAIPPVVTAPEVF